jgi:hypothetical protein
VRDGQASPHRPRLVVSRSTCPPLSPSPLANSFIIGTAVINTHTHWLIKIQTYPYHFSITQPQSQIHTAAVINTHNHRASKSHRMSPHRPRFLRGRLPFPRHPCPPPKADKSGAGYGTVNCESSCILHFLDTVGGAANLHLFVIRPHT